MDRLRHLFKQNQNSPTDLSMAIIEYTLYRVKFVKKLQMGLFPEEPLTTAQIFKQAISERPSITSAPGKILHVGNVSPIDNDSGYFAIGRTTNSSVSKFDESTGDFVEEDLETSPYTHCVYQSEIGIVGIAQKRTLTKTTAGLATWLEWLLGKTKVVEACNVDVEILPISNPQDFITEVSNAWAILKFTASFRGPNPVDADELFQKPLSAYTKRIRASMGKTEVRGETLDPEVVVAVSRSTAAGGNSASAAIKESADSKARTIHFKDNFIKRSYDENNHSIELVIQDLVRAYQDVRVSNDTVR